MFLDIIEGEATRRRPFPQALGHKSRGVRGRPLRGMGDWRGSYPSALGTDDAGLVSTLMASGHIHSKEDLEGVIDEQMGSSEFAKESQKRLKGFLESAEKERERIDKLVEEDESRRSHI